MNNSVKKDSTKINEKFVSKRAGFNKVVATRRNLTKNAGCKVIAMQPKKVFALAS